MSAANKTGTPSQQFPKIRKAVLPVAGLGTRVLPATKAIPKEMLPVFDRPAIQYVVDEALEAGIEHIIFVTGRNKNAIEDYFDRAYELEDTLRMKGRTSILQELDEFLLPAGGCSFVRQQAPLGLGHAIGCARAVVGDEPFAVLLPDVLVMSKPGCLRQMMAAYEEMGGNVLAVDPVDPAFVHQYGVIDPAGPAAGRIIKMRGMVEKPKREIAPSCLRITGRYILQPEIMRVLADQAPGAGAEIQLTDAMARLMEDQAFYAYEFDGRSYDCGDKVGYLTATAAFALAHGEFGAAARDALTSELARAVPVAV